MAVTVDDILDIARKEIGTKATAVKKCKYNTWYYGYEASGSWYDWCAVFICWLFNKADAYNLIPAKSGGCGVLAKGFHDKGQLYSKGYKSGDIVFFHWSDEQSSTIPSFKTFDHVGIIEKVNADGSLVTIEGNTGNSDYGEVMRRTRYASQVSGVARPAYSKEMDDCPTCKITMQYLAKGLETNKAGQVLTLQRILSSLCDGKGYNGKNGKPLVLDGDFGENTEYALLTFLKAHKLYDKSRKRIDVPRAVWAKLLCEYSK